MNELAAPFGIKFGDSQIGKSVNYLDVTLYIDNSGKIQYKLYKKDTDARLYLNPASYHPENVFESVIFSQMIRVIDRNSKDETCVTDLEQLKQNLIKSGHNEEKIEKTEPLAVQRAIENKLKNDGGLKSVKSTDNISTLVFTTSYFHEVKKLKTLVNDMKDDINQLCGETRVIFALKKHQSISNKVVRNRKLSGGSDGVNVEDKQSQTCGARGCMTCPLLFNFDQDIVINGDMLVLDKQLTCKDKNVIYVAQCQICVQNKQSKLNEDSYFGQTLSEAHTRFNGHRNKFVVDERILYEKSALSQHCYETHPDQMKLSHFKLGIVKKCNPCELDREETRFILKFRTNICGLNRIKVVR